MSTIAITQLAVSGKTPSDVQVLKVHPKTGKINLLFLNEGQRNNDGTMQAGSELNFALLESDSGDANDWTLINGTGTALAATASASHALGTAITVGAGTGIITGDVVAVTGADKDKLNGVFEVLERASASATTLVLDLPWVASMASLTAATVTEVAPIQIAPGGQENSSVLTQKKLIKLTGWGTTSGGYARLDLQFNGLHGFGQVDIEVNAAKTGYGFFGNGAAGVGGMGRDTAWPETP
jgi:hypothetical protein